ncbi:YdcF family protein [Nonomuraea sp. NPDC049400]|uniref:YdcF family protein n=1 Tax=Nonomuraea sp. NPDC049400 TaxID=3364352 RepID=UPI0037B3FDD2
MASDTTAAHTISDHERRQALLIWDYHQMRHPIRPCEAAIGLGSHDLGVADTAVDLYRAGLFPVLVFSGGNSPTTKARFPRGEAVHFRERAIERGLPPEAVLLEPHAGNTGQNLTYSRRVLAEAGITPASVLLISKPYMERRSYATARQVWPETKAICASEPLEFDAYLASIGDARLVLDMLVGDLQRIIEYPKHGFAIEQDVPGDVYDAYVALIRAGYDSRLLAT